MEEITGVTQDLLHYAPVLVLVLCFLLRNKFFVTPEQLQIERRALMKEVENRFLSLVAFREFEKRIDDNFRGIKERLDDGSARFDKVDITLEHITDMLINKG